MQETSTMYEFIKIRIPQLTDTAAEVVFLLKHNLSARANGVAIELFLSLGGEPPISIHGQTWATAPASTPLGLLKLTVGALNSPLRHGLEALMSALDAQSAGRPNRREMAWILREVHDLLRFQYEEVERFKMDQKDGEMPHTFGSMVLQRDDYRAILNQLDALSCEEQGLAAELPGASAALAAYNALGVALAARSLGNQAVGLSLEATCKLREEIRGTIRALDKRKKLADAVTEIDGLRSDLSRIVAELRADIRFTERGGEDSVPMLASRARHLQELLQRATIALGA